MLASRAVYEAVNVSLEPSGLHTAPGPASPRRALSPSLALSPPLSLCSLPMLLFPSLGNTVSALWHYPLE